MKTNNKLRRTVSKSTDLTKISGKIGMVEHIRFDNGEGLLEQLVHRNQGCLTLRHEISPLWH